MSNLAEAELYAPGTERDPPGPPEGSWQRRRAEIKAQVAKAAASVRAKVLDRIPPGGISRSHLAAKLDHAEPGQGWLEGLGGILEDLFRREEAHEEGGLVFRGPGAPRSATGQAPKAVSQAEVAIRILQVARTQAWWHPRALLSACHPVRVEDGIPALATLRAEGTLADHPSGDGRIGLRPEPVEARPLPVPVARAGASAPAPDPVEPIGAWVRRRRTELGLGQRQLGEIAGISSPQGTISQLERGIRHETTHLAALERVLGPRGPIRDALSSDLESPPPESVGGDRSPEGGDPPAVAGSPAQPSPPAPVAESSIEEPASTSVAESEPAVVSPADPDQEARGRTATAGAAATAGAPDAPYDTISPPPAQGASSQPVGEREGCDLASGPASRLPDLSNEGPGSVEDEVDEHPVPPDLLDELVDLRLRLEVAERQIAGYRAEREAPGDRLVLVPAVELADLEARAARVDRAEAELVEARRFGVATERLLDRAEPLHVRRDDDRWIRLGALGNVIDRLVVRANKEAP